MFIDVDKTRENEELLRMLRLETDLGRYQTFVINAGKVKKQTTKISIKIICFIFSLYLHYLMNNKQVILNQNQNDQKIMMNRRACKVNRI
jgi:hypothetical protein